LTCGGDESGRSGKPKTGTQEAAKEPSGRLIDNGALALATAAIARPMET
jgi:hypothetical protein